MKNEVTNVLGYAQDVNSDHMQLIAKLLNLKDHLQKQILMGILYRKLVIWMDLNIQSDEFVHSSKSLISSDILSEVVEAINIINDCKEQLGFVPSKLFYKEVGLETLGTYSINNELTDCTSNVESVFEAFVEMENLIKKNFKLSSEKILKFTDGNPVQLTLREELELVYKQKNSLEDENQNLKLSLIANRENDSKNLLELHQQVEKLKNDLQIMTLENKEKIRTI